MSASSNKYAITLVEINAVCKLPTKISAGTLMNIVAADEYGVLTFIIEIIPKNKFINESREQKCSNIEGILFLTAEVFKFAAAIADPIKRIDFCRSEDKQKFISQVQLNDPVKIPCASFSMNDGTLREAIVKYIVSFEELGPGLHFIVSLLKRDWTLVHRLNKEIAIPNTLEINWNRCVILSAEHIFERDLEYCPPDVGVFHVYRSIYYESSTRISLHSDVHKKAPCETNNKNTSKTLAKPFNGDGQDVYVIDFSSDGENAIRPIVKNTRYEDRTPVLLTTNWLTCAKPQFATLNGKPEGQTSSTNGSSDAKPKGTLRTKSSNPLDHFNQESRNGNKNIPPQNGKPSNVDGKDVYVIDYASDGEDAKGPIVKKTRYEDRSAVLLTTSWPACAEPQFATLNGKSERQSSSTNGRSDAKPKGTLRTKSSNPLDHFNQESRNANKNIPPQNGKPSNVDGKDVYVIDYASDGEDAKGPIVKKTRYEDRSAVLLTTSWPACAEPQFATLNGKSERQSSSTNGRSDAKPKGTLRTKSSNPLDHFNQESRNGNKNIPPQNGKPSNVDGKDVYVIDFSSDGENAIRPIVKNTRYEDRTPVLLTTNWLTCAKPQFATLNGKPEGQTSSTNGSSDAKPKGTLRTKSSNPLDHFNQESRNGNKNIPPQNGKPSNVDGKDVYVIDYASDGEDAKGPIVKKTRYEDRSAVLLTTSWPACAEPQFATLNGKSERQSSSTNGRSDAKPKGTLRTKSSNPLDHFNQESRNGNKNIPPQNGKPSNVDGKDVYVIDYASDGEDAKGPIVKKTRYEDRSAVLLRTSWPACAEPQFATLNGKPEGHTSSTNGRSDAKPKGTLRTKSSNPLDHFNQESRNGNKNIPPQNGKPSNVDGKDVYVIDYASDGEDAKGPIVKKTRYEDRSAVLLTTSWPACAEPQFATLNGKPEGQTSSTNGRSDAKPKGTLRTKSSNPLDHFNQESRNANKNIPPQNGKPSNVDGKDVYVIDYASDGEDAKGPIVKKTRYEDRSAVLLTTSWPACAEPQFATLNGKSERQSSSTNGRSDAKPKATLRTKSSNPLDHFNQESRNGNKNIPPQNGKPSNVDGKDVYVIDYASDGENAKGPIVKKTRYEDRSAVLLTTSWPACAEPQFATLNGKSERQSSSTNGRSDAKPKGTLRTKSSNPLDHFNQESRNGNKNIPPQNGKPSNVDGKDVYVIDYSSDGEDAKGAIVKKTRYENRTPVLLTTNWLTCANPQFATLNGKPEGQTSSINGSSDAKSKATLRTKSSNPLDHFNQESRNANKNISPQTGKPSNVDGKDVYVIDYASDGEDAKGPIVKKTRYEDRSAVLLTTSWPACAEPQFATLNGKSERQSSSTNGRSDAKPKGTLRTKSSNPLDHFNQESRNGNKNIPPQNGKPSNVDGKDVYVIDYASDGEDAKGPIVKKTRYEDRSAVLLTTSWPACAEPQFATLNGKPEGQTSSTNGRSDAKPKATLRTKSSNPLDHFNQESRNANKNIPPQNGKPSNVDGKDVYVIDFSSDGENAKGPIVKKTRYEDRSAVLLTTSWPACAEPQFATLNGKPEGQTSSTNGRSDAKPKGTLRTKSSNPLDHFNQESRNANKNIPPQNGKLFNVDGKDVYVIDYSSDGEDAKGPIVKKTRYEDRSAVLLTTSWPACAEPQFATLNGKPEGQTSSTNGSSDAKPKATLRTKSSNPLDHFNQESRNANKNIPPQTLYSLRKRR